MSPGLMLPMLSFAFKLAKTSSEELERDHIDEMILSKAELLTQTLSVVRQAAARARSNLEESLAEGTDPDSLAPLLPPMSLIISVETQLEEVASSI